MGIFSGTFILALSALGVQGGSDVGALEDVRAHADGVNAVVVASFEQTGWERMAETVLFSSVDLGVVAVAAGIVLCLLCVIRGPTTVDRGIAADTIAVLVAALVVLFTIRTGTLAHFDIVLIVGILGFASTVAFAQYIGRRRSAA